MNWIQHPVELTGNRVKLIPLEPSHFDPLCELAKDPAIWELNPFNTDKGEPKRMREGFVQSLEKQETGEQYNFTIVLKENDAIIGSTKFWMLNQAYRSLEIGGTWMHPDYWGTGLNMECKYLLLHFCFETLGTIRVQIKANDTNIRSRKAIEKLGATYEGILRKDKIFLDGTMRNSAHYSIIDDEWPAVKARLNMQFQQPDGQ